MRCLMAFFVLFALIATGTPVKAQAPPSSPWDPIVEWLESLLQSAVSGEPSDQRARDYYHQFLSSKSQAGVTEAQFVNYWRYTGAQAQGGQLPSLSYSIASVTYNETRDQAHVTYQYRVYAAENAHTGSSDVVLENRVWKMVLSPDIIADIQKAPATQSRPSPIPSRTVPLPATPEQPSRSEVAQDVQRAPGKVRSIIEAGATSVTSSSGVSETLYGVHLRWDPPSSPWGLDVRYLTGSIPGYTDNLGWGYLTYRWGIPNRAIRLAGGYFAWNEAVTSLSATAMLRSPLVGIEGQTQLSSEISLESGGFYLASISTSCSGCVITGVPSTAWMGYVGLRYATPTNGIIVTGGYNFMNFGVNVSIQGPYLSLGFGF